MALVHPTRRRARFWWRYIGDICTGVGRSRCCRGNVYEEIVCVKHLRRWPSECDDVIGRAHVSRKQRATASRGHWWIASPPLRLMDCVAPPRIHQCPRAESWLLRGFAWIFDRPRQREYLAFCDALGHACWHRAARELTLFDERCTLPFW